MNWDALGAIGDNVGALALVVSVLYPAYQVTQSTRNSKAFTQREIIRDMHRRDYVEAQIESAIDLPPPLTALVPYYGSNDGK